MRARAAFTVAAGVLAGVGILALSSGWPDDPSRPAEAALAAQTSPSPSPTPPTTATQSEGPADARQAAMNAVSQTGRVVEAGMFSRQDVIARFATERLAPLLASDTSTQVNGLLVGLGVRGVDTTALQLVETPISAVAEPLDSGDSSVRVRVWSVIVVSVPGAGAPKQVWRTVTLEMVPVGGRWLVDGWVSTPGPSPVASVEDLLVDGDGVRARLSWPSATEGGR